MGVGYFIASGEVFGEVYVEGVGGFTFKALNGTGSFVVGMFGAVGNESGVGWFWGEGFAYFCGGIVVFIVTAFAATGIGGYG